MVFSFEIFSFQILSSQPLISSPKAFFRLLILARVSSVLFLDFFSGFSSCLMAVATVDQGVDLKCFITVVGVASSKEEVSASQIAVYSLFIVVWSGFLEILILLNFWVTNSL